MEKNIVEKTIDKRNLFVAFGCAKFPYARIKELYGDKKVLNLEGLSKLPILDDEKVQAIQACDFFTPPLARLLALNFATATYQELKEQLSIEEAMLCEEALAAYTEVLTGAKTWEYFYSKTKKIASHIKSIYYNKPIGDHFQRIAAMEIMVCLSRKTAKQTLIEVSSVQRDVFGDERGTQQLQEMLQLSQIHYDERMN